MTLKNEGKSFCLFYILAYMGSSEASMGKGGPTQVYFLSAFALPPGKRKERMPRPAKKGEGSRDGI